MSIYGSYASSLSEILNDLTQRIQIANQDMNEKQVLNCMNILQLESNQKIPC